MTPPLQRGIDHVVFAVNDLDATCALFNRLGFTTTPRTEHRGRAGNSVVQFHGNYIELYTVTRRDTPVAAGQDRFSFARFNAGILQRRTGITMLAFASDDARRDLAEFTAAGLTTQGPQDFTSDPTQTGVWDKEISFSLAFVTDARMPDAVCFVCQQHAPENYWLPTYQQHANSAQQIEEVVMVAETPAELASLFGQLQRPEQVRVEGGALHVATARGQVTVLTPAAFTERYRGSVPLATTPHFAAVRIAVGNLDTARAVLTAANIPAHGEPGRLWVEPALVGSVLLELTR